MKCGSVYIHMRAVCVLVGGDNMVSGVGEIFLIVAPGKDVGFRVGVHFHTQGQTFSFTNSPGRVIDMCQVNKSFA